MTPVITTTSMNNLNSNISNFTPSLDTNIESTKTKRARTLYPCEADNISELSFEANVIISNSKILFDFFSKYKL